MSDLRIEEAAKLALDLLFGDPRRVTSITVRRITGTAWDVANDKNVDTVVDAVVPAVPLKHTQRSVKESRSPDVQIGEQVFLVRFEALSNGVNNNDMVLWNGQIYNIRPVDTILDLAYVITCKGG